MSSIGANLGNNALSAIGETLLVIGHGMTEGCPVVGLFTCLGAILFSERGSLAEPLALPIGFAGAAGSALLGMPLGKLGEKLIEQAEHNRSNPDQTIQRLNLTMGRPLRLAGSQNMSVA